MEKIDLGQLARCLIKGRGYITACLLAGLLGAVFLNLLSPRKSIYQQKGVYLVKTGEEVCPLRKEDIESYVYGKALNRPLQKGRAKPPGLCWQVMVSVTEPKMATYQLEKFELFSRGRTFSEAQVRFDETEKRLYDNINRAAVFYINGAIDELVKDINSSKNKESVRVSQERLAMYRNYKGLILEGKLDILERLNKIPPQKIWQMPNMFFDLSITLIISFVLGIVIVMFRYREMYIFV